jgi:septal ring factor EnvC (AmiA/AmiB activator)
MPTKEQYLNYIKLYKAKVKCPKKANSAMTKSQLSALANSLGFNINQPHVVRFINRPERKQRETKRRERKTTRKEPEEKKQPALTLEQQIEKLKKEIAQMRTKAGKIAESKGRITKEVRKMLDDVNKKTKEMIMLKRELRGKKKSK